MGCMNVERRRIHSQTHRHITASPATPPTTPPIIAPSAFDDIDEDDVDGAPDVTLVEGPATVDVAVELKDDVAPLDGVDEADDDVEVELPGSSVLVEMSSIS